MSDEISQRASEIAAELDDIHFNSRSGSWLDAAKAIVEAALLRAQSEERERAAKLCEGEAERRMENMEAAKGNSWDWGEPRQAEVAQGHKSVTARALAAAIRNVR